MDPKRKRIYLIIIASCLTLSAAVLFYGFSGGGGGGSTALPLSDSTIPTSAVSNVPAARGIDGSYPAPLVFPLNTTIDTSVFDSSNFKTLQPYQSVQIVPSELGRDDPFKNY